MNQFPFPLTQKYMDSFPPLITDMLQVLFRHLLIDSTLLILLPPELSPVLLVVYSPPIVLQILVTLLHLIRSRVQFLCPRLLKLLGFILRLLENIYSRFRVFHMCTHFLAYLFIKLYLLVIHPRFPFFLLNLPLYLLNLIFVFKCHLQLSIILT